MDNEWQPCPDALRMSGLVQMIRMGKSIRQSEFMNLCLINPSLFAAESGLASAPVV